MTHIINIKPLSIGLPHIWDPDAEIVEKTIYMRGTGHGYRNKR